MPTFSPLEQPLQNFLRTPISGYSKVPAPTGNQIIRTIVRPMPLPPTTQPVKRKLYDRLNPFKGFK